MSTEPIHAMTLFDFSLGDGRRTLTAHIKENGDLALEGVDSGSEVEKTMGDWDYEYWLTVPAAFKDTVLLWLIKERFENSSALMGWLSEKNLPHKFDSWR